jgi:hypothetical protein
MSTSQATIDFILDQVEGAGEVRARKMFGEYALYCDEKVVALVCDDTLYIKITEPGREFVGSHYAEGAPYPGAKPPASCRMCLPWRAAPAADRRDISPAVGWPVSLFSSLSLRKTVSLQFKILSVKDSFKIPDCGNKAWSV